MGCLIDTKIKKINKEELKKTSLKIQVKKICAEYFFGKENFTQIWNDFLNSKEVKEGMTQEQFIKNAIVYSCYKNGEDYEYCSVQTVDTEAELIVIITDAIGY